MSGREECRRASTFLRKADKKGSGTKELFVSSCVAVWLCAMWVECAGVPGKRGSPGKCRWEAELLIQKVTVTMHMPLGEEWKVEVGCLPELFTPWLTRVCAKTILYLCTLKLFLKCIKLVSIVK